VTGNHIKSHGDLELHILARYTQIRPVQQTDSEKFKHCNALQVKVPLHNAPGTKTSHGLSQILIRAFQKALFVFSVCDGEV